MCRNVPDKVSKALLVALQQTVNGPVFQDQEARGLFLPTACAIIKKYLVAGHFLNEVSQLLGDVIIFFCLRRDNELSDSTASSDVNVVKTLLIMPLTETVLKNVEVNTTASVSYE